MSATLEFPAATSIHILAADRIPGMMHVTQLLWLAGQAAQRSRILEVGSWRGRSTRALCDNTSGIVTAVDTWLGAPGLEDELTTLCAVSGDPDWLFHEFQRNLADARNLRVIRKPSLTTAADLARSGESFDMIFLDGLHDHASVVADIRAWWPLVSAPGLLCGHDLEFPDVASAVRECFPGFPADESGTIWAVKKV